MFDRLYDNYRVIACSSLFRFNLDFLLKVLINKLGVEAVERFSNFTSSGTMNQLPLAVAKKYRNIIVFDQVRKQLFFDLAKEILGGGNMPYYSGQEPHPVHGMDLLTQVLLD